MKTFKEKFIEGLIPFGIGILGIILSMVGLNLILQKVIIEQKASKYIYREKDIYYEIITFENCFTYEDGYMLCK